MFHMGQLMKEDLAQKGLLQWQIHTKPTYQLWVTLPPKISRFSPHLPLPFKIMQSISTTNTISSSTTVFYLKCTTTILFNTCSIFNYTISHILGTASLPISVNNWGSSRQQCLYSNFFIVSKDIPNKQILPSTEKLPTTDSKLDSSLHVWWGEIRYMTVSYSHHHILVLFKPYLLSEAACVVQAIKRR